MTLDYEALLRMFSQLILPLGRISGLMLVVPFFSSAMIPPQVKVFFMASLCWVCAQFTPSHLSLVDFNGLYLVYLIQDMAFGVMMGFILQLVFQVFVLGGQVISMQAGLGFAVMVDPSSRSSLPVISQMYLMIVTLMFLALDGHIALLDALIESFRVMPIGSLHNDKNLVWGVLSFSGWMFKEAILVSIPAILSLLIVNLSFGIMTRVAPQLNIFSLGFPITLLMGFIIIKVGLPSLCHQMVDSLEQGMLFIKGMIH